MKLRVAAVQINSLLGEVEHNKRRILGLLAQLNREIDMVVLPELALTGYNFSSPAEISPFLDTPTNAISTNFAKELLQKYGCFTVIGYPQQQNSTIYNSCGLISPKGDVIHNYHKTFLYETDEVWGCSENPEKSFSAVDVVLDKEYYGETRPEKQYATHRLNFGICMDLNPYKFEAPFNKFEFAMACYANRADLIVCPMAWLSPHSSSLKSEDSKAERLQAGEIFTQKYFSRDYEPHINASDGDNREFKETAAFIPQVPDFSTVNYHILRFFPFMNHRANQLPKFGKVNVVCCNRIGVEDDVVYGGSSSMFEFTGDAGNDEINHLNSSVHLRGALPMGTEGVLYREIEL